VSNEKETDKNMIEKEEEKENNPETKNNEAGEQ